LKKDMHLCPQPERLSAEQMSQFDQHFKEQVIVRMPIFLIGKIKNFG